MVATTEVTDIDYSVAGEIFAAQYTDDATHLAECADRILC